MPNEFQPQKGYTTAYFIGAVIMSLLLGVALGSNLQKGQKPSSARGLRVAQVAPVEEAAPAPCPEGIEGIDCPPSEQAAEEAQPPASLTAGIARTRKMGPNACPEPFRRVVVPAQPARPKEGLPAVPATTKCVLDEDLVLSETLALDSFTTLDCQNHTLTPAVNGNGSDPTLASFIPSSPRTAILLNGVYGAKVQNCVIGDSANRFDFGVYIANSKVTAEVKADPGALERLANRISSNNITSQFLGVNATRTDNLRIEDNTVTINRSGFVIGVFSNSDLNQVKNNQVSRTSSLTPTRAIVVPSDNLLTIFTEGAPARGILLCNCITVPLVNSIFGDTLVQTQYNPAEVPENNLIEGNTVDLKGTVGTVQSIFIQDDQRNAVVRGNTVKAAQDGITALGRGLATGVTVAGTCSANPDRFCLNNTHCNISGIDAACPVTNPTCNGTCQGVLTGQTADARDRDTLIEGNILTGPFSTNGINAGGYRPVIRNNRVSSGLRGISLGGLALHNATVTRNVVAGATNSLFLNRVGQSATFGSVIVTNTATSFGAKVSLNDFTGYTNEALTSNDYAFASQLSDGGRGNYWGLACPGFNPTKVKRVNGTVNPNVSDSHAYSVSVANTPDASLPAACQ